MTSMRGVWPILLLVLVGCSESSAPAATPAPATSAPADWTLRGVAADGLSFRLPPTWVQEGDADRSSQMQQDPQAMKASQETFASVKTAYSAMNGGDRTGTTFPFMFTLIILTPKQPQAYGQSLFSTGVADAKADSPDADVSGGEVTLPVGRALRIVTEDSASIGSSTAPGSPPRVVAVRDVQYQIPIDGHVYLLDVTGPKEGAAALDRDANVIAESFSVKSGG